MHRTTSNLNGKD